MHRTIHRWLVQLQRSDGEIVQREYATFWDPEREGAADLIAEACAAEASVFEGGPLENGQRRYSFAGLTAIYTAEPVAA